ncbi:hypothetical protein F383_17063 [Gossypium arboreum]|uniref:Uncharacterized protein n=1 Tax=Gossypium arboreum TaxID=29729 RepID=A0A0B0NQ40_GOSAR|nr:hypothetical protein F383_17063 [Gossypium arboreum]
MPLPILLCQSPQAN